MCRRQIRSFSLRLYPFTLPHNQEQHMELSTGSPKEEEIISLETTTTTGRTPVIDTTRRKALAA